MSTLMHRLVVLNNVKPPVILEEIPQHISKMTPPAENLTLLVKAEDQSKVGIVNFHRSQDLGQFLYFEPVPCFAHLLA